MNVLPHRLPRRGEVRQYARVFDRLALGIDFSTASLGAARWATAHLGRGGELVAVHVGPFPDGSPYELAVEAVRERALEQLVPALAGGLGGFATTLEAASARVVVRVGTTSRALIDVAETAGAELVVLGRRARGRRHAIDEPNVVARVSRDVLARVLVVPEGEHGPVESVLVAVDDGEWAPRLLREAHDIATTLGAELTILHVLSNGFRAYERLVRPARGAATSGDDAVPEGSAAVREWIRRTAAPIVREAPVRIELATGEPGRAIVRIARTLRPGLVVVGKRGVHGAPMGSLGSAAREALSHAACPVLAVEFDDGRDAAGDPGVTRGRLRLVGPRQREAPHG